MNLDPLSRPLEREGSLRIPTVLHPSLRKHAAKEESLRTLYNTPFECERVFSRAVKVHDDINDDDGFDTEFSTDDSERLPFPAATSPSTSSGNTIELTKLVEELAATKETLRKLQQEWNNRAAAELRGLQPSSALQIDDNWLQGIWSGLRYKIKDWARQHFLDIPSKWFLRQGQYVSQGFPSNFAFERIFEICALRCAIVQNTLWTLLLRRIFVTYPLWTERKTASAYNDLFHQLKPKDPTSHSPYAKQFECWRAQTSALISAQRGDEQKGHETCQGVRELADEICDEFEYLSSKPEQLMKDVLVIISDCVEINKLLCQQRARYRVGLVDRSYPSLVFRPDVMEDMYGSREEDTNGQIVVMKVSPALYKYGTSAGEDYDKQPLVLAKATVLLYSTWRGFTRQKMSEMRNF